MKVIRTEPDGTVTAEWSGHLIRDARRGFILKPFPEGWQRREPKPVRIASLPLRGTRP